MSHKKETPALLSQEDTSQVEFLFTQYHQIAEELHSTTNQAQAEVALTKITSVSEDAQLNLAKALAKENQQDAADVLLAINTLSPHKEVRKQARRSLIRLEATKTYPQWTPPLVHAPAIQLAIDNPPRFWKAFATQTREEGEMQLLFCWEQGYEYGEIRMISFLLDFWQHGVKDVSLETGTRRHTDERISDLRRRLVDTPLVDCTLAEGKRLLEEALTVNAWRNIQPANTFHAQQSLINKLLLQVPDPGEDRGRNFITQEMEDEEVIINFLGAWSMGDYGLAYDLLTRDSRLHDDLPRDEWIEIHRAWANEARPTRLELGFVHEIKNNPSAIWLPASTLGKQPSSRKEVEIGWSLEVLETPLSGTLKEMPLGSSVNKETGRHWFWTSYTVVREQGAWRIQKASDEALRAQGSTMLDLQTRIKEHEDVMDQLLQDGEGPDVQAFLKEASWRLTQQLHLYDALIIQLPLDESIYEEAYSHAVLIGNPERILVYLDRIAQRFATNRVATLRRIGSTLAGLAYRYDAPDMQTRQKHLLERAEESLRSAIALDQSPLNHILLGELFLSQERIDEAEVELLKAQEMQPGREDEASIEAGFGNIAMRREKMDEAIPHYQRVAEIDPKYTGVWFSLGFAQRLLGNLEAAESAYEKALQLEPEDTRVYAELTALYINRSEDSKARSIMEQGLRTNPQSAYLHALFASLLFELGDRRSAQQHLETAEELDPELEIVQRVHEHIHSAKRK